MPASDQFHSHYTLFLFNIIMLNVESVFVILIGWLVGRIGLALNSRPILHDSSEILPSIGILRVKAGANQPDAVTGLIMIQKDLAVANAYDMGNIKNSTLRKLGKAMFYVSHTWRDCDVTDCVPHPEYYDGVKNTLALVYLKCDTKGVKWVPLHWPSNNTKYDDVHSVGYTDRYQRLQQFKKRMEFVNRIQCGEFYKKEKLDYKSLQPSHCICYKDLYSNKECLMDAGMALVARSRGVWTLIGISTLGPGCSLPSRFIRFLPYLTWINSLRPVKIQQNFRRSQDYEKLYSEGMWEPFKDQDTVLLQKINDSTIILIPAYAYLKEEVYGLCDNIDSTLMYREFGTIRAPTHTATAVYSLSLYDLFFPFVRCVKITVMCNKRSQVRFWITSGFDQEDIEDYVKTIPAPSRDVTKAPKIWYLKDTYKKYRKIAVGNFEFKFEFTDEAKMDLEFYGRNVTSPMKPFWTPFLWHSKAFGKFRDGADFRAHDYEPGDNLDTNDSFYYF